MSITRKLMRLLRPAVLMAGFLPLLTALFLVAEARNAVPSGFNDRIDLVGLLVRPLLIASMTITGIFARILYDQLKADQNEGSLRIFLKRTLRSRTLWMSLICSPIVILACYKSISDVQDSVVVALMTFENGFCCHAILEGREQQKPS